MIDKLQFLQDSPFLEGFRIEHLEALARHAEIREFAAGETIIETGSSADYLYLLVQGNVRLWFPRKTERSRPGARTAETEEDQVLIHSILEPGRPLGWSAVVEPFRYRASATAIAPTTVLGFRSDFLQQYCRQHVDFGIALMHRVLWVLGNRLRAARVRLVARRYEQDVVTIRAVLAQNAALLPVTSPLHKLPHFLESRLTLSDAFHVLEELRLEGSDLERQLAVLCLDVLENVRKEMRIYQRLQNVYEVVAGAPESSDPGDIRRRCLEEFAALFAEVDYVIRGEDNLPKKPGHIFIMNHLVNHPENTLPNDFHLTLDTHFVSAMILMQRYQAPPIRVIRKARPDEYAHQKYYDRLGYIYVYRGDVDDFDSEQSARKRRDAFIYSATQVLASGKNLVICPEGSSRTTEESPTRFRAGAFRLAAAVRPEPLIVPIAVANFDKRIARTRVAAVIHPPFLLSDFVQGESETELFQFINTYYSRFVDFVAEARQVAAGNHSPM